MADLGAAGAGAASGAAAGSVAGPVGTVVGGIIGGAVGLFGGGGSKSSSAGPPTVKPTYDRYGNKLTAVKDTQGNSIVIGSAASPLGDPKFLIAIGGAGLFGIIFVALMLRKH